MRMRLAYSKKGAKDRGIIWELTDEEATACILGDCYYCGAKPDPVNGIDRVDNSKGYLSDNTVPACSVCNMMKQELTLTGFLNHCTRILTNFND